MRQASGRTILSTKGKGLVDFTATVIDFVDGTGIAEGVLTLFCRHTSASLLVQENADPDVQTDLKRFFETVAPEGAGYVHGSEGPDDMPAHIRAALTRPSSRSRCSTARWCWAPGRGSTFSSIGARPTAARSPCTSLGNKRVVTASLPPSTVEHYLGDSRCFAVPPLPSVLRGRRPHSPLAPSRRRPRG